MHIKKTRLHNALIVLCCDIVIVNVALWAALLIRFEFVPNAIPEFYIERLIRMAPLNTLISVVMFYAFRMYHMIWSFVGVTELGQCIMGVLGSEVVYWAVSHALNSSLPRSVYVVGCILELTLVLALRYSRRFYLATVRMLNQRNKPGGVRTMIIGAGSAGQMLTQELVSTPDLNAKVCCIIDDNPAKFGLYLKGAPIVGGRERILESVKEFRIQQIILAIPSESAKTKKEILDICKRSGCRLKTLPGIYQLVNGEVSVSKLRDVEIEDLLGRESVKINTHEVLEALRDKVIMVTGGGGSIGSELCRQIATHRPARLILVDIYENNAYDIQQELKRAYKGLLPMETVIASVRDRVRMEQLFEYYRPQVVFHAAAHKHVPLMEDSPNEAIKNNVFGTLTTARCADKYGAEKFVLISTDKAVNPTNIMGASKRLCEMVVQTLNKHSNTDFVAVRFGNVLGSNGSVIPLFRRQIMEGGPVTVTDPNVIRFFMTIPEAVSLVLQAGTYAQGGEIFILDMGDPVRIDDLARNLIRLSGFEPDVDIRVQYTGLRPGEKLYEETLMQEEHLRDTENSLIHIGRPIELDEASFFEQLEHLREACERNAADIKERVAQMVPTYHPQ